MNCHEAYSYLKNHPLFKGHFKECLDVAEVKVCPATNRIEDDDALNTKPQVWLECGPWGYFDLEKCYTGAHDPRLDCGGDTFEEAICVLAKLVMKHYGAAGIRKEKTRLKWKRLLDPSFDMEAYTHMSLIDFLDSEYYELKNAAVNDEVFSLFVNVDNNSDYLILKSVIEDGSHDFLDPEDDELDAVIEKFFGDGAESEMPDAEVDLMNDPENGNRNTVSKGLFALATLLWFLVFAANYWVSFFRPLPGISAGTSKIIFSAVVIVLTGIGFAASLSRGRNNASAAANCLIPIEIYALITYVPICKTWVLCAVGAAILLLTAFTVVVVVRKADGVSLKRRLEHGLQIGKYVASACLLLALISVSILAYAGEDSLSTEVTFIDSPILDNEWSVENKMDTVMLLDEHEWAKLDKQERLDVLGTMVNIELRYLGVYRPTNLECSPLDADECACFDPNTQTIKIDSGNLMKNSAEESLNSICHECYHAYEHQQVELYSIIPGEYRSMQMFYETYMYAKEFSDYISSDEGALEYSKQHCEENARSYAAIATERYYRLIEMFAGQTA